MSTVLHVAAGALARITGFSDDERELILDSVLGRGTRSTAVGDACGAILRRLGDRDFVWPEFDRWQALFAERCEFPALWDHLKVTPPAGASTETRHAYREHKLRLLLDWLHGLEVTRPQVHVALARYARRGVRAGIARQGDGAPCPVCDPLNHREVHGTPGEIPPFHPGCRCLVLAIG